MARTFGGMPEKDASHWDTATKQELGRILFLIISGNSSKRRDGYNAWYSLKRSFMPSEWDEYLSALDIKRKSDGHRTMDELILEIGREMIDNKVPLEHAPESDLPQSDRKIKGIKQLEVAVHKNIVKAEQLDMFSLLGL